MNIYLLIESKTFPSTNRFYMRSVDVTADKAVAQAWADKPSVVAENTVTIYHVEIKTLEI